MYEIDERTAQPHVTRKSQTVCDMWRGEKYDTIMHRYYTTKSFLFIYFAKKIIL